MLTPFMRSLLEAPEEPEAVAPASEEPAEETTPPEDTTGASTEDPTDDPDPFSTDVSGDSPEGEEGNEDLSNPPDGLPSPDSTEDTSTSTEETDEQNIQLNILPLSKLDRLTLKRRCYSNFKDLRVKIDRVKTLVDDNEHLLDPAFRDDIEDGLSELYTAVSGYMTTKFSYNNYEENTKNYTILATQLDELVKKVLNNKDIGER